jgi:predicted nucleotidyltransferase
MAKRNVSKERAKYSSKRLSELCEKLAELQELQKAPKLTIFGAGSYARLEASSYSDLDMFFMSAASPGEDLNARTNSHRIFGKVIEIADELGFPAFSNDGEYLEILRADDIRENLGNRADDHKNYFTARMLMLLESRCLYGEATFRGILEAIVGSYFKDFPDHKENFKPTFLVNDISRYWKTLLLNYENKRGLIANNSADDLEVRKTKHRVRNFKLKFSRLTTCFATIAAIGSYAEAVTEEDIVEMVLLTPRERLQKVRDRLPNIASKVDDLLGRYDWFLEQTGLTTAELELQFSDTHKRKEMFGRANEYGDAMYELIANIDGQVPRSRLLRTLVI